jgi:hypothetical protein
VVTPEKKIIPEAEADPNKKTEEDTQTIMAANVQSFYSADQNRRFKIKLPEFGDSIMPFKQFERIQVFDF